MPGISELRERHPRFVYESYNLIQAGENLDVQFHFTLEPGINFAPTVSIPIKDNVEVKRLENFAFHLGLIEAISYWKAACAPELFVKAGRLTDQQISWWHDLFIHGLGELYYQNGIDFTPSNFLSISSNKGKAQLPAEPTRDTTGDLVLVGGGKDSAVTLQLLKGMNKRTGTLVLNPIQSAVDNVSQAGYEDPIVVRRNIDPTLLDLNKRGYVNGHTPFSAYLAFLGVFVGTLRDFENVIVSNERGASEGNVVFHSVEINHQYSKSFQFERLFREYCAKYLSGNVQYFSFLRPLYDLQISRLFADRASEHFLSFRSCNSGQKENAWCGKCAKCAFVYLSLSPFLSSAQMMNIFGNDYFRNEKIGKFVKDLVGLGDNKPFECVGTEEESKLAVALTIERYKREGREIPSLLGELNNRLGIDETSTVAQLKKRLSGEWSDDNFLPPNYAQLLRDALRRGEDR